MNLAERNAALRAARSLGDGTARDEFVMNLTEVVSPDIGETLVGPFLRHIDKGKQIHDGAM